MWDLIEGKGDIYSKQNCFQSFTLLGFTRSRSHRPVQAPSLLHPGAVDRDTVCHTFAMSSELFFTTGWLLHCFLCFLGLTCYYGVIFHLRVLLFLVSMDLKQRCYLFASLSGASLWRHPAFRQGMEEVYSLTLMSSSCHQRTGLLLTGSLCFRTHKCFHS